MVVFLNRVMNFGCVLCISTIRTLSTCLGRGRSIAGFNMPVNCDAISRDKTRHTTKARALNPPNKSALSPIAMSNGLQISLLLSAAMNKSSVGLVHRSLMR
jgi:hypothetical protein